MANYRSPEPTYLVWKTLANGQTVKAEVEIPTRWNLSGKFAMWARCFGCSIDECTAMYFADDRAALVDFVGSLEKGRACAERGFEKIEGHKIPDLTKFAHPFVVQMSQPDQYREVRARIEIQDMNIRENQGYITLQINGKPPAIYFMHFEDAGTVGYARMHNQWAVTGRLTNVSMDWTNPNPSEFPILNMIGTIDKGVASFQLWCTAPEPQEVFDPAYLYVPFNTLHWYIQRAGTDKIRLLKAEKATVLRYFPTTGTIHYTLQKNSIGQEIWHMTRGFLTARINAGECELQVTPAQLEEHFKPINEVEDLNVNDIKTDANFWDTFGKSEVESFMRWLIIECQKAGKFEPVTCSHAHQDLCDEGLLTDFGDFKYLPTRKAIRILAGKGFHKSL